jgi:hypothetical protein
MYNYTEMSALEENLKCDIFTPDFISSKMADKLLKSGTLLDPCVGTGNLLKFLNLDNYSHVELYELKDEYIKHINDRKNIKKNIGDFLKMNINYKYTNIILNPPYIKIQELEADYRDFLRDKFKLKGNLDIYYAFILKCITHLSDDGVMVSITPNSYLYNKSSFDIRKHLIDNKFIKEIIDFGHEKVFKNASVYTCITIFSKSLKESFIYNGVEKLYNDIHNYSFFEKKPTSTKTLKDICKIKNGIATLRNNIYIHDEKLFDEPCWKPVTSGKKPQYIIYPYKNEIIVSEDTFKTNNPLTYIYLEENKTELAKRDNGNKTYPMWYSYGRTQSIKPCKKAIIMPCFCDPENIENYIVVVEDTLYYSCLCIEPINCDDIQLIVDTIIKNKLYIKQNSSKRSGGWVSLSSSVLNSISLD